MMSRQKEGVGGGKYIENWQPDIQEELSKNIFFYFSSIFQVVL